MRRVRALAALLPAVALLMTATAAAPPAQAAEPYDVTLSPSTSTVVPYDDVNFSGQVTEASGDAASGTMTLQLREQGASTWRNWRTTTLGVEGSYDIGVTMTTANRNWEMRAMMPEDSTNEAGYSAIQQVTVGRGAYNVTLSLSNSAIFVNGRVKFSGRVRTVSGRNASGTMTLQLREKGTSTWRNWRTTTLGTRGSYTIRARMRSANRVWEMRAMMPENSANEAGYSTERQLTVNGPTATEARVITLVNRERTKRGLRPVCARYNLTRAARHHSSDMANRNRLTHYSANGYSPARRMLYFGYTRSGYRYWATGEDVARATSGTLYATPEGIVDAWMHSPAHRRVILYSAFRDVGVGVDTSTAGSDYFTLDMGRRKR